MGGVAHGFAWVLLPAVTARPIPSWPGLSRLVPGLSDSHRQAPPSPPSWSAQADHPRGCWPRTGSLLFDWPQVLWLQSKKMDPGGSRRSGSERPLSLCSDFSVNLLSTPRPPCQNTFSRTDPLVLHQIGRRSTTPADIGSRAGKVLDGRPAPTMTVERARLAAPEPDIRERSSTKFLVGIRAGSPHRVRNAGSTEDELQAAEERPVTASYGISSVPP